MFDEYEENRQLLSDLIAEKRSFTLEELEKEFRNKSNGKIQIGRLQNLADYLDELREFGVLGFSGEKYTVQKRTPILA